MSLIYKKGDILEATENIICHQVNVQGCMGGGLAKQIASRYPKVEKEYQFYCENYKNNYEDIKGDCLIMPIDDNKYIANCFTQEPNFATDYNAINECFNDLLSFAKEFNKTNNVISNLEFCTCKEN